MLISLLILLLPFLVGSQCFDTEREAQLQIDTLQKCYDSGSGDESADVRLNPNFFSFSHDQIARLTPRISSMGALRTSDSMVFPDYENVLTEQMVRQLSGSGANSLSRADDGKRRLQIPQIDPWITIKKRDTDCLCEWCDKYCDDGHICENQAWNCDGEAIVECGTNFDGSWKCYCDIDIDGADVCWENDYCVNRPRCYQTSDCLSDEVCITTCCDGSSDTLHRCFKECKKPYPSVSPTPRPPCCQVDPPFNWECLKPWTECGRSKTGQWTCICDYDVNGNWFCWQDDWCSNLSTCTSQCPPGYACIPNTCCGVPKCIKKCDLITRPIVPYP